MLSLDNEIPNLQEAPTQKPLKKKSKLLPILIGIGVGLILIFMFVPGLKENVINLGRRIKHLGPYGPFILVPLSGFIVIPFGLPFMIFEMTNALITGPFFLAVFISLLSKFVGGTCCYFLGKYKFKQRIVDSLEDSTVYQGIDKLINYEPLKISCMIRMTNLPLFIKSYGLLLSDKVNYWIYTAANMSTGVVASIIEINIFRQARNLTELLDGHQSALKTVYSIISLLISLGVFLYIIIYTRKIVKMLQEQTRNKLNQGSELQMTGMDKPTSLETHNTSMSTALVEEEEGAIEE